MAIPFVEPLNSSTRFVSQTQFGQYSSLSEASRLFDPSRLKEIIAQLGEQAHEIGRHEKLSSSPQNITLVDGTLVEALPRLMEASLLKRTTGSGKVKWRLHPRLMS